jgi:hypothetical protein
MRLTIVFVMKDHQTRLPVEGRIGPFETRQSAESALAAFIGADRTGATLLRAEIVDATYWSLVDTTGREVCRVVTSAPDAWAVASAFKGTTIEVKEVTP